MQLKAIIKNISKEKSISAQLVMQNFITYNKVSLYYKEVMQ
jgi:hypothetical protein